MDIYFCKKVNIGEHCIKYSYHVYKVIDMHGSYLIRVVSCRLSASDLNILYENENGV